MLGADIRQRVAAGRCEAERAWLWMKNWAAVLSIAGLDSGCVSATIIMAMITAFGGLFRRMNGNLRASFYRSGASGRLPLRRISLARSGEGR
jgi:hypothetical protein